MVNKVILIGNVGADPEIRTIEGGSKVARINLATSERVFNKATNETKEYTEWHRVTIWGGLADVVDRYIRKGSQLYIEGSLRTNEWTDQSGAKRYSTDIVARELKMLGRRQETGQSQTGGYGNPAQQNYPSQETTNPVRNNQSNYQQPVVAPIDDVDDLPF